MTTDDELRKSLEELAGRGSARGAANVLEAARRDIGRDRRPTAKWAPVTIAAAATLLVVSVAAVAFVSDDRAGNDLAGPGGAGRSGGSPDIPTVAIDPQYIAETRLQQFGDCNALLDYARGEAVKVVGAYGLPGSGGGGPVAILTPQVGERLAGGDAAAAVAAESAPSGPAENFGAGTAGATAGGVADQDFSTTNVQEKGVDEADTVKTDGKVIYAMANQRLFAVSVADHKVLGSIILNANEFFLAQNRVIAFGSTGYHPYSGGSGVGGPEIAVDTDSAFPAPGGGGTIRTVVSIVDVSDPKAMKIASTVELDGSYVSSRMVNDVVRVVTSSSPRISFPAWPAQEAKSEHDYRAIEKQQKAKNAEAVRNSKPEDWLPRMTVRDAGGRATVTDRPVPCDATYRPPELSGFSFLNVTTLNTAKPEDSHTSSVMADGQTVYSSGPRLYVATGSWGPVRALSDEAAASVPPVMETLVHQFDISDPAQAAYRKSGKVRGHLLNQFSMSEDDGVLRIATTDGQNETESFVTSLADQKDALVQVGQVGGLGKTERIYAVRFIGKVAYVVTFRQIDPLYTIDLSDPTKPRVVGELKITGYSAYLHPIGDGKLIGVGQEASAEGRRQGTQVSLFDVSNPAEPKRLAQYHLPGGDSPAEFDHHAFLYWAAAKMTVIPYQQYERSGGPTGGAVVLRGDDKLDEAGKVTHRNASAPDYNDSIQRSLVVGDRLYTVSLGGIKANDLGTLAEKAWVSFT